MMKVSYVIMIAGFCLLSFIVGRRFGKERISEIVETVTEVRVDTVVWERVVPRKVVVERVLLDTLYSKDTVFTEVYIPIGRYVFEDSLYRAEVSGYRVSLDKMEVFNRSTTTTVTIPAPKPRRFGLGLQAGYGVSKDGLTPYFGVGLSYNILTF